ncbi:matrixin family metalloprotease [Actinophytocola sp.]|uniref:matrixin family metalloprotease n=1 Tax=Actinophytocola sp. TaxID=1872138 RepID=UPI002ED1736C
MRKGALSLTTASLIAAAFVAAVPVFEPTPAPAEDITVIGEAILATPTTVAVANAVADTTSDCASTAYALEKWRLSGTHTWSYNPAGAPATVAPMALTTIQRATTNLTGGQNRCGTRATLAISQAYSGTNTKTAQISPTAACTGNDGISVTSWGALPANTLGYTCVYYKTSTGTVIASDMMLNSTKKWFTGNVPAGCTDSFDLESVVTHERGHTAGLSHVDQTTQARQTMSPRTLACTTYKRLIGSGDLTGLQALSTKA